MSAYDPAVTPLEVSRVVVVDFTKTPGTEGFGRAIDVTGKVVIEIQDEGRTLKAFVFGPGYKVVQKGEGWEAVFDATK